MNQGRRASLLGLIVVRDGQLPLGGLEVAAECHGRVLVAGDVDDDTIDALERVATDITVATLSSGRPTDWARPLADLIGHAECVVLPASADGRDLAPALALARGCRLYANALRVTTTAIDLVRSGGLECHRVAARAPFVATLQPGVRGIDEVNGAPEVHRLELAAHNTQPEARDHDGDTTADPADGRGVIGAAGAVVTAAILPPDVSTIDLAEAPRIVAGGAGLDSTERFDQLAQVATRLGASLGTTRVVTDRGWLPHERQIGTTGVVVDPRLYMAFAISGAVQHTSGLGQPDHIIAVNTDPHCPMMQLADLAIVSDANAVVEQLVHATISPVDTTRTDASSSDGSTSPTLLAERTIVPGDRDAD